MKKFWRNIHLYLSLLAGIIFFIECLSGTLLVFEDEITEMIYAERYYVSDISSARLSVDQLVNSLEGQINAKEQIGSFQIYENPKRTVEVALTAKKEKKKRINTADDTKSTARKASGDLLYVHPYTGDILARINPAEPTFFRTMLKLHQSLLLDGVGKTILSISTFIVLVILITGIILWWPKNKKILKQRFQLKTNGSWKRLNHDLHVVLGFYCSFFLIIFLVTSLPWSFKWANEALYTFTNSKPQEKMKITLAEHKDATGLPWQVMLDIAQKELPAAPSWRLSYQATEFKDPVNVSSPNTKVMHRNGFDQLAIDPFSGELLQVSRHEDSPAGWQIRRYMKPVHTGAIGGIPTKIIAFVVCLLSATFPITGIILWFNRLRKANKKKKNNTLELV